MRATLLVAAGLALGASACGSSSSDAPAPIPLEHYCEAVAQVTCDRFVPCCASGGVAITTDDCLRMQSARCGAFVAAQQSKGHVYDAVSAGACVHGGDAVFDGCVARSLDYWASGRLAESCVRVWTGTAKPGETCSEDADCAASADGDVSCGDDGKGGHACIVERLVGAGAQCDVVDGGSILGCASGSYCAAGSDGSTSICIEAARVGQECNPSIPGACVDGLACDFDSRTCVAPRSAGESCLGSVPCDEGLYCGNDGTCVTPIDRGGFCHVYDRCASGLVCVDGKCSDLLDDGASCNWSGQCKSGRCDVQPPTYDSGTCVDSGGSPTHVFPEGFDSSVCFDLTDSTSTGSAHP